MLLPDRFRTSKDYSFPRCRGNTECCRHPSSLISSTPVPPFTMMMVTCRRRRRCRTVMAARRRYHDFDRRRRCNHHRARCHGIERCSNQSYNVSCQADSLISTVMVMMSGVSGGTCENCECSDSEDFCCVVHSKTPSCCNFIVFNSE